MSETLARRSGFLRLALLVSVLVTMGASAETGAEEPPRGHIPTLEDIQIEGELAVPQVLFITARDQRRAVEFMHRKYLKSSLELCASTPFPRWIGLVSSERAVESDTDAAVAPEPRDTR